MPGGGCGGAMHMARPPQSPPADTSLAKSSTELVAPALLHWLRLRVAVCRRNGDILLDLRRPVSLPVHIMPGHAFTHTVVIRVVRGAAQGIAVRSKDRRFMNKKGYSQSRQEQF